MTSYSPRVWFWFSLQLKGSSQLSHFSKLFWRLSLDYLASNLHTFPRLPWESTNSCLPLSYWVSVRIRWSNGWSWGRKESWFCRWSSAEPNFRSRTWIFAGLSLAASAIWWTSLRVGLWPYFGSSYNRRDCSRPTFQVWRTSAGSAPTKDCTLSREYFWSPILIPETSLRGYYRCCTPNTECSTPVPLRRVRSADSNSPYPSDSSPKPRRESDWTTVRLADWRPLRRATGRTLLVTELRLRGRGPIWRRAFAADKEYCPPFWGGVFSCSATSKCDRGIRGWGIGFGWRSLCSRWRPCWGGRGTDGVTLTSII